MMTTLGKSSRGALVLLAALGLAGRVLVPAGFMPAPLADGWPVKLCPASAGAEWLAVSPAAEPGGHANHRDPADPSGHGAHQHSSGHGDHDAGDRPEGHNGCPVGAFFAATALLESPPPPLYLPELARHVSPAAAAAIAPASVDGCRPRGPPAPRSLDA